MNCAQNEYNLFKKKEHELRKREEKLQKQQEYTTLVNRLNSKVNFEELRLKYDTEIDAIKEDIKAKMKENKRLNEAFKAVKDSNEALRLQVNILILNRQVLKI